MPHPLKDVMCVVTWHVFRVDWRSEEFLRWQPAMCSGPGDLELKSSNLQYSEKIHANPLQAGLGTICDFLIKQFEVYKRSYSTINSYRSALSSMLWPVARWLRLRRTSYFCSFELQVYK